MAKQTFIWFPDAGSTVDDTPLVNVTKFGDGYESRTPDAINVNRQTWSLTFSRGRTEVKAARAFLKAHYGTLAFLWTSPLGDLGTYVARKWSVKSNEGILVLTATFEEVFES